VPPQHTSFESAQALENEVPPALRYPFVKAYIHDPKEAGCIPLLNTAAVLAHDMPIQSTGIVN
jgi:hypothetical protein